MIKNNDTFVIRDNRDLEKLFRRIIDERDGNTYTKPNILSIREQNTQQGVNYDSAY